VALGQRNVPGNIGRGEAGGDNTTHFFFEVVDVVDLEHFDDFLLKWAECARPDAVYAHFFKQDGGKQVGFDIFTDTHHGDIYVLNADGAQGVFVGGVERGRMSDGILDGIHQLVVAVDREDFDSLFG